MVIESKNVQNIIHDNMMSYSSYVITNRALPDIRDGLKPSYRRILTTMHSMNISNFTKSANVSGETMKVHPHGDCYPTIVGMVQSDTNITPLITGKGSFGQHTSRDLQAAAARYTEIKLSEISKDIFKDLSKNMVKFIPNYDGTIMLPEVLPVKFPAVLHYAQSGIAVGMSCNLPSFNLVEINNAVIKYILTDEHEILIPDFATGGKILVNESDFDEINNKGKGTIRLRATAEIIDNTISVTEIPYTTTREAIIDSIIKLIKSKKITEVANVHDLTGLDGMRIEIVAKRNTNMELLLEKLFRWTPMEDTFSANMNMLVNGLPRVMGVHKVIETWVKWRRECIRKGIKFELQNLNEKLHVLMGLEQILLNIDRAVEIIRFSNENEINERLMVEFKIDEFQADYVSNMKLKNLNKDVIIKRIKEIDELKSIIKEKEDILNDNGKVNQIIIDDLNKISQKYGTPRRTQLTERQRIEIPVEEVEEVQSVNMDEEYKILITKDGYLKKNTMDCMNSKIKEGDEVIHQYIVTNKSEILVFIDTDAYKLYVDSIPVHNEEEFGMYLPAKYEGKEILGYGLVDDSVKDILIIYDNMKVAKINNRSYRTSSRRTKLENSLFSGAKPLQIVTLYEDVTLEIHNKNKVTYYDTANLKTKSSRYTQGVLIRNDEIIIK